MITPNSATGSELPYGMIFAILMCCMMIGASIYRVLISYVPDIHASQLLVMIMAIASICFCIPAYFRSERIVFWCFCIFEMCCGMYFPLIASRRGRIIEDRVRARIYGWMRVPLNMFVVVILATVKEGTSCRDLAFEKSTLDCLTFSDRRGAQKFRVHDM